MAAVPEGLKREYQEQWQAVVQSEGAQGAYDKLKDLGGKIAFISGNKKPDELSDSDFKAFGLSKQQYDTVLSRIAMNDAVSALKSMTNGSNADLFATMKGMEGLLADTEYAKKGGMKHAQEVLLSLSGSGLSVAGYDDFKKGIGRAAAQKFGDNYRNTNGQHQQGDAKGLLDALAMAGQAADDATIRKYTGESKQEFEEKRLQQAMIGATRGGGDRHFEIFMQITQPSSGRGR